MSLEIERGKGCGLASCVRYCPHMELTCTWMKLDYKYLYMVDVLYILYMVDVHTVHVHLFCSGQQMSNVNI